MNKLLWYLWLAAASFTVATAVCIAIDPTALVSHSGFSYYGNLRRTIIPYGLGLVATAYFLVRACQQMKSAQIARSFRIGLETIAVALLGIVATPSLAVSALVQNLHVVFGLAIYTGAAFLSLRYLIKIRGEIIDWVLLCLQIIAIILAGLSFYAINVLNIMLPAQLLAMFAFGALLIRAAIYRSNHTAGQE